MNQSDTPTKVPLDGAVRPLVERLRQRTLPKHGGREEDSWNHHWNLTIGDSELHRDAAAELERLNKWCDEFADAQLKERAACEAHLQAMRDAIGQIALRLAKDSTFLGRHHVAEELLALASMPNV